jgi:branched-chain amino acid transport system permease protein
MPRRGGGLLALVAIVAGLVALQLSVSHALNAYLQRILLLIGINMILAVSLNLINGFTGQFSIGHAGFMAIGAYTSAALTYYIHPAWTHAFAGIGTDLSDKLLLMLGLVSGAVAASFVGVLVGIPSLRLRGDYLAIVTLGFGEMIRVFIQNIEAIGGARGFTDIPPLVHSFAGVIYAGVALTVLVVWNLVHSAHGRGFLSVREDEIAAEALGVPTTRYKVISFAIGSAFAGLAGALFAHFNGYLHPSMFWFMRSIEVVIMVVLGGMGSITGSLLAAVILTILPEWLRPVNHWLSGVVANPDSSRMIIYALLLIVLMIARPKGLFGHRELTFAAFKRRRAVLPSPGAGSPA